MVLRNGLALAIPTPINRKIGLIMTPTTNANPVRSKPLTSRDVLMAKKTGVFSIWAAYGANHDPNEYEKLVRITHWTPADVKKEKRLQKEAKRVKPDYVAERSFSEILPLFLSNGRALKEEGFTTQSNQAHRPTYSTS